MRKVCKKCKGKKHIHLPECETLKVLDGNCNCKFPVCPDCEGTGERNRKVKHQ